MAASKADCWVEYWDVSLVVEMVEQKGEKRVERLGLKTVELKAELMDCIVKQKIHRSDKIISQKYTIQREICIPLGRWSKGGLTRRLRRRSR